LGKNVKNLESGFELLALILQTWSWLTTKASFHPPV
jgi:hypothetical protein